MPKTQMVRLALAAMLLISGSRALMLSTQPVRTQVLMTEERPQNVPSSEGTRNWGVV